MTQSRRLPEGGFIDRSRPLRFTFEGRSYVGYAGDTLAAALLANGVKVVGRSFKYHRPRGILTAGVEEPNALVRVGEGPRATPNIRATEIELTDGLVANPINCWPSLSFDIGSINDILSRFLAAGFYYKTFMLPHWHVYEWAIRRAAGLGRAPDAPDPDVYEWRYAHCDVLVVGGGAAGLAAARAAATTDARVILVEQQPGFGGRARWTDCTIDGKPASAWADETVIKLRERQDTTVLNRTTAISYHDHNAVVLLERVEGEKPSPRLRLWQVRAGRVILATGATERPLVFPGNDRPGVMLSSAVREYIRHFAVRPADRAVVFTNNDDAYATAEAIAGTGAHVTLVDTRSSPSPAAKTLSVRGIEVISNGAIVAVRGTSAVNGVEVREASARTRAIPCDLVAMSGGFNPNTQLHRQSGGRVVFDETQACFRPSQSVQAETSVGGCAGTFDLASTLCESHEACAPGTSTGPTSASPQPASATIEPCWLIDGGKGKAFVDFQHDVTSDDIALAVRENYTSVEHLKRYTTLGMATDQGKTSNVNGIALLAQLTGQAIGAAGAPADRPPFTPVAFGAMAGSARGELFRPMRLMPAHDWHAANGAVFEEYGGWKRPAWYKRGNETAHTAEQREALAVRQHVGIFDGSPLGKIEVKGPDAAKFLDRIYANTVSTLKPGKLRYGIMLNELGVVIDDGVTARLTEDTFVVGTTSSGATRIAAWLEEWLQCEWLDLDVIVVPVTTDWAVLTVAGPNARAVLAAAGTDIPIASADFPHMSMKWGQVAGVPARIYRVSFTGELSYEVNVPARHGCKVWEALMKAGEAHGIEPIGVDALMLLRMEKGYVHIGADTDGTTSAEDIGWGHVLKRTTDFVGKRSLLRPDNRRKDRPQFVGLEVASGAETLTIGAQLCTPGSSTSEGYVTSAGYSPTLARGVALGMVKGGTTRMGESLEACHGKGRIAVRITQPCTYDPSGERLHG
jgi:sarcosine oxidase subunit alpha